MSRGVERLEELACNLAAQRVACEINLIGAVLSEPLRGTQEALSAGIAVDLFDQPDLGVIFTAAVEFAQRDKSEILMLIRAGLRMVGYWDDTDTRHFARRMHWCNESLVDLACSHTGPHLVTVYAHKLRLIDARLRQARQHYRRALGLLADTDNSDDAVLNRHRNWLTPYKGTA